MPRTADIEITDQNPLAALTTFFSRLLDSGAADAILVPKQQGDDRMIMPTLITDPAHLAGVDPLAPAFALNAARLVSRLTRRQSGGSLAVVLRPCEIRAFIELVKLNQGSLEDLLMIGIDCPGAFRNQDYFKYMEINGGHATDRFIRTVLSDKGELTDAPELAPACRACIQPVPEEADLAIGLFGLSVHNRIQIYGQTPRGEALMEKIEMPAAEAEPSRQEAIEVLISRRTAAHEEMLAQARSVTDNMDKLADYFSRCVNCYNCRVACPVCYCRECVFVTDVFDHEPARYLKWAHRTGEVKMPTDTLFYHLTRMAHMSTACVGCGQCSNACPSQIPVMELFAAVAADTQEAFGYVPGRSVDEPSPMSVFKEKEFEEVVGIKSD